MKQSQNQTLEFSQSWDSEGKKNFSFNFPDRFGENLVQEINQPYVKRLVSRNLQNFFWNLADKVKPVIKETWFW